MDEKLKFPITMNDGFIVQDRDELSRYLKYKKYDLNKNEDEYNKIIEKYYSMDICGYGLDLI